MRADVQTIPLKVVVVEDDRDLCDAIVDGLQLRGFHAEGFSSAEDCADGPVANYCDLAVIDLNLPGESGYLLVQRWRQENPNMGIVILSARADSEDRRLGYSNGADLYLTKPASITELVAAINSIVRRRGPPNHEVQAGAFILRVEDLILALGDSQIAVTRAEANLLAAFVRAQDQTIESWQIAEIFGHGDDQLKKSYVELQISRLRRKLEGLRPEPPPIRSIRGVGYQLVSPVVIAS